MNIQILHLKEGARAARGLTVIIDVFRAFTVAPYLFKQHASCVIPVSKVKTAFDLKTGHPDYILIGERNEDKVPGFDFGNSPSAVSTFDFTGKTVVHTTSSGTQGIINAVNADQIITGSFVNVHSIVRYIQQQNPAEVSLVCMGYACEYETEEDTFCAEYIKGCLEGMCPDFEEMKTVIRNTSGARFFDPAKQHFAPSEDFYMCLQTGIFDFVLKVMPYEKDLFRLTRIDI